MPRHSPYALFRLNSRSLFSLHSFEFLGIFQLFCLSFANNCFLGCKLKDLLIHTFSFVRHRYFYLLLTKLFPQICTEKPFKIFSNKFFSIYNYLFRFFFLYSVFNEHVTFFEKKGNQRNFILFCSIFRKLASCLAARPSGLVEMMGFEPMTPCLQGRCSPS